MFQSGHRAPHPDTPVVRPVVGSPLHSRDPQRGPRAGTKAAVEQRALNLPVPSSCLSPILESPLLLPTTCAAPLCSAPWARQEVAPAPRRGPGQPRERDVAAAPTSLCRPGRLTHRCRRLPAVTTRCSPRPLPRRPLHSTPLRCMSIPPDLSRARGSVGLPTTHPPKAAHSRC